MFCVDHKLSVMMWKVERAKEKQMMAQARQKGHGEHQPLSHGRGGPSLRAADETELLGKPVMCKNIIFSFLVQ